MFELICKCPYDFAQGTIVFVKVKYSGLRAVSNMGL